MSLSGPDTPLGPPKVPEQPNGQAKVPGTVPETSPESKQPEKKVRKQWKNPALRAMGIPRPSLPSRNWMIFWCALGLIGGGIAYDKYEQKQIRNKWMKKVELHANQVYPNDRLPRKLSIFIAPPPNDFLDLSLRYFRRYIKPILNAAAVDFDVYTENRQGDIRAQVAEKIRQLRRERLAEAEPATDLASQSSILSRSWNGLKGLFKSKDKLEEDEPNVARNQLYTPKDLLGMYQIFGSLDVKRDDELHPEDAGGVICIGRGAYKEYITGIHEGLLGPLEKPEEVEPEIKPETDEEAPKTEENEDSDLPPVPKPFILPKDYKTAEFAPELPLDSVILNDQNVPVLFEQPVYVFAVPKIQGFLNIPRKIYNFYTLRYLADEFGSRVEGVLDNKHRKFEYKDIFMAGEEERDWPKNWVKKGKEKGSEWVQDLEVDERITKRMKVFDPSLNDKKRDMSIQEKEER